MVAVGADIPELVVPEAVQGDEEVPRQQRSHALKSIHQNLLRLFQIANTFSLGVVHKCRHDLMRDWSSISRQCRCISNKYRDVIY
jgi:hypothetical protein